MKTIIEMAREVKMPYDFVTGEPINLEKLEAFASLVRADERMSFYGQDKPAECADGCPPNQICDYCQVVAPAKAMILAEREACAKLVEDIEARCIAKDVDDPPLEHVATAIRERGHDAA
jgi:hypothetical protein